MDLKELTRLRLAIRTLVRDCPHLTTQWHETDVFNRLSPSEQVAVRALEQRLLRANGQIEALLPAENAAEWC